MAELKTSIRDIPVANERIYTEVAKGNKLTLGEVRGIMDFMGNYIAGVIKEGRMETAMLPYFGKFKPKVEVLKAMKIRQRHENNGMDMVFRALKGMRMKDFRAEEIRTPVITASQNNRQDETI